MGPIRYADYLDTATLRESYANDPDVSGDGLMEVDFVCHEGKLSPATAGETFDYVCAAHVFEHLTNPLGWLRDAEKVLVPGGALLLAIPDMRFTFDVDRPVTTAGDWLQADELDLRRPTVKMVHDCHGRMRHVDSVAAWEKLGAGIGDRVNGPQAVRDALERARGGDYVDSHCTVYTPASLLDVLEACVDLELLSLSFDVYPPRPYGVEFYVAAWAGDAPREQRAALDESHRRVRAAPGPGPLLKARFKAYDAAERARALAGKGVRRPKP